MKVVTRYTKPEPPKIKYPILMKSGAGRIVLFIEESRGVLIKDGNNPECISEYREDWFMDSFDPLPDDCIVELSNGDD
jgi:hypothetical protein